MEGEKIFAKDVIRVNIKMQKKGICLNSKKKKSYLKLDKALEQTLFQRSHTNDQQVHEKVISITNYQRNANQNPSNRISHLLEWLL